MTTDLNYKYWRWAVCRSLTLVVVHGKHNILLQAPPHPLPSPSVQCRSEVIMSQDLPKDWVGICPTLLGVHGMTCQGCPASSSLNKDLLLVHWRPKTLNQAWLPLTMMMINGAVPLLWWLNGPNWVAGFGARHYGAKWVIKPPAEQSLIHLPLLPIATLTRGSACPRLLHPASCFDSTGLNALWPKQAVHSARPRDLFCSLGPNQTHNGRPELVKLMFLSTIVSRQSMGEGNDII